jgi:PIN domain nuclease of toxin-antitoxin system
VRVLLDTHAFLWATTGSERLSGRARDLVADPGQELLLSAASAYEIAVKAARGRLELPEEVAVYLATRMATFGLRPLAVTLEHAVEAAALPRIHADPWDRIIVAQARAEAIPILTADPMVRRYDVETIW